MVTYCYSSQGITPDQLRGFFEGWPNEPTPETHLRLLQESDEVIIAVDEDTGAVIGFITAITDRVLSAYIPFLEVLPAYRRRGIGGGLNGYCDKGYAMLSTICLRANEVRMVEDNLATINGYRPVPEWFASDSCSFPADGGWYWFVKEATDDYITLRGCEGATYRIDRYRAKDLTTLERIH